MFKLTSLSNWMQGKEGADIPKSVQAKSKHEDEFSFFRLMADLMMDNPPNEKHAAQYEPFHYIGLIPGQPFSPEKLSKPMQDGLVRAAKMGPKIMKWKVKFRGTSYETRWNMLHQGSYGTDYFDRAAGSLEGLMVHDYSEAIFYSTYESYVAPENPGEKGRGEFLNTSLICDAF